MIVVIVATSGIGLRDHDGFEVQHHPITGRHSTLGQSAGNDNGVNFC
jgi:hypothetical protein